jgi:hypothetical protein
MMTLDEFRREMNAYRDDANAEAKSLKSPYVTLERLDALYIKFDDDERVMANQVIADWVLSEDEALTYDGQHLVRKFKIVSAIPALQELAKRLATSKAPGVKEWLEVVNRLIEELSKSTTKSP